jgi:hypothetical protein
MKGASQKTGILKKIPYKSDFETMEKRFNWLEIKPND